MTLLPQLSVRPASVAELDAVMTLLKQRVEWLRARGFDQWSTWETWRTKMGPALEAGHVWLLCDEQDIIGTISVEFYGDTDFWSNEECAVPAAYLSKLAVRVDYAGNELGALLTEWASDYAYRRGCRWVRLDAWKANQQLHEYYASRGWTYVRTVANPGRNSGTLFQLPVRPMQRQQRRRLRDDFPIMVLPTQGGPGTGSLDAAGNWHPNHVHRGGMTVQYAVSRQPSSPQFIDFMRYRLREEDQVWQLDAVAYHFVDWRNEAVVRKTEAELASGTTYVVTHQEVDDGCRMVVASIPAEFAPAGGGGGKSSDFDT